ncbi:PAS domain-containing protein [bacterium]|nr:PAS domain-containing protein [bacterium]
MAVTDDATVTAPPEPLPAAGGGWWDAVRAAAARTSAGFRAAVGRLARRGGDRLGQLGFDAGPQPMWVVADDTLRVLAVNAAVVRRFGYAADELCALTLADLFTAADRDRLAAAAPGRPVAVRHRTRAGVLVEVELTAYPLPDAPRPARLLVAGDAPAARRTEAALREREELLKNVIAHIPVGVFWKDRASLYLGCNEAVALGFGLTVPGEVAGRTDYELAAEAVEADASRLADRKVMDTAAPVLNQEETRTGPDGAKRVLMVSRVPLRDAAGKVVGVIGVSQDVTERQRLEEQLRQAQKMEAVGRLAGGVAHDFNNLLTIIMGNLELLDTAALDYRERGEVVQEARDAATRAAALTRQLLTFSRRQPVRPEPVDVNEVVDGLVGLLRRLLGERVTVRTALAPNPVIVRVDRGHLEQVLMNLAVNARDAMPGGGTVTLGTAEATSPAGPAPPVRVARLTVTDTGVGMTDAVKAKVFEPFFTTKDNGKGTGLGLATVYGIVCQAGGQIEVESAPGAGTTFRIGLPWSDLPPRPSSPGVVRVAAEPHDGGGRSVLLVEDEDALRRLARNTLEMNGYAVADAPDGEAALDLLGPHTPLDVVVTDMVMPGMDGRELAGRVRALRPGVGVVLTSGYVPDAERLEGIPGSVFLAKPYTPAELVRAVARAVARAADTQSSAPETGRRPAEVVA